MGGSSIETADFTSPIDIKKSAVPTALCNKFPSVPPVKTGGYKIGRAYSTLPRWSGSSDLGLSGADLRIGHGDLKIPARWRCDLKITRSDMSIVGHNAG